MGSVSQGMINGMINRAINEVLRKEMKEEKVGVEKEKTEVEVEAEEEKEKIEEIEKLQEESVKPLKGGMILNGQVVQVDKNGVLVSVGNKVEGFIPLAELSIKPFSSPSDIVSVGDEIKVYVITPEDAEGNLILSKKRIEREEGWNKIVTTFEEKKIINGTVINRVKGGLIVDLDGIKGFIPASEVSNIPLRELNKYLNKTLPLIILSCNRKERKIILSHKAAAAEEIKIKKQQTLESLYEGKICQGRVVRVTAFGVFVDIGRIDGLIHLSELSYRRVKHPKEVVRVGDKIDVMVLAVDKEKGKVSLSLKQTQIDPWQEATKKFEIGSIVTGKVSKIANSYIFVHLSEGIEGLVPFSEVSVKKLSSPSEIVKEGQEVKVKVLDIKPLERRMLLSLKKVYQEEEKQKIQNYLSSQKNGLGVTLGDVFKEKFGDKLALIETSSEKKE